MNNNNLNRFYEFVGADSENYNEISAKESTIEEFIAECLDLVIENKLEYSEVTEELESLAIEFWNHHN